MRILVTGGAGFIGSHLVERLLPSHDVTVVDWNPLGHWSGARQIVMDCRDIADLKPEFDFCYHLASTVGVTNVLADPKECIENIIESTRAVLSLRLPGIYFSTSEVYGKTAEAMYSEESALTMGSKARWSYAAAKLVGEWLAKAAGWKVVRLFNVVGPRQSNHYGAVLPRFTGQAVSGNPITVYGDGTQVRTFLDVRDCVAILDRLRGDEFDVLNVGGTAALSIQELADLVKAVTGSDSPIVNVPYEKAYSGEFEECPARIPDLSKLRSLIGDFKYRPFVETISELSEVNQHVTMGR